MFGSRSTRLFSAAVAPKKPLRGPSGTSYFPFAYIDLRSDTVTRPCEKMRDAMANAVVGDDIYSDCPTTNKLQKDIAKLLGKEAALLTASGTQANCVSMMTIAEKLGDSVVMGNWSHIVNYERGGIGMVGTMPWIVANEPNGEMPLD